MPGLNWSTIKQPSLYGLTALCATTLFFWLALSKVGGDISYFIFAGDRFTHPAQTPSAIFTRPHSDGYDGQFIYRLAREPFTKAIDHNGVILDKPTIRQQRIVYPLLVHIASLGIARLVPIMLIAVNLAGVFLVTFLASLYAQSTHHHPGWGLVFGFYWGFLFTLSRDLGEIVTAVFILVFLLAHHFQKNRLLPLALTLMLFSKETTIFILVALAVSKLRGQLKFIAWPLLSLPVFAYGLWYLYLHSVWPAEGNFYAASVFVFPFTALSSFISTTLASPSHYQNLWTVQLIFYAALVHLVISSLKKSSSPYFAKVAWVIYALLAVSFSSNVWQEDWSFARVLSEFFIMSLVVILGSQKKITHLLVPVLFLWLWVAADIIGYRLG